VEKTNGNSNKSPASPPNIEFLTGKERKEWVNFLIFGGLAGLFGGSVGWTFGGTIRQ
jgi:hypothetical protein